MTEVAHSMVKVNESDNANNMNIKTRLGTAAHVNIHPCSAVQGYMISMRMTMALATLLCLVVFCTHVHRTHLWLQYNLEDEHNSFQSFRDCYFNNPPPAPRPQYHR